MRAIRTVLRVAAAILVVLALAVACWTPTEVELDVYTDITCVPGRTQTQIFLARSDAAIATADGCEQSSSGPEGNRVGSFVVAPSSGPSGDVEVEIVLTTNAAAKSAAACHANPVTPPDVPAQCVVARRAFSFEKHASEYVNVRLFAKCLNVPCDQGLTCEPTESGTTCADDHVATMGDPCPTCGSDADPVFGSDSGDGSEPDVGTIDAAPDGPAGPCSGPAGDGVIATGIDRPQTRLVYEPTSKLIVWMASGTTAGGGNGEDVMALPTDGGPPFVVKMLDDVGLLVQISIDAHDRTAWTVRNDVIQAEPLAPIGGRFGRWNAASNVDAVASGGGRIYFGEGANTGVVEAMSDSIDAGPAIAYSPGGLGVAVTNDMVVHNDATKVYRELLGGTSLPTFTVALAPGLTGNAFASFAAACTESAGATELVTFSSGALMPATLSNRVSTPCVLAFTPNGSSLVWADAIAIRRYVSGAAIGSDTQIYAPPVGASPAPIRGLATDGACLFFWTEEPAKPLTMRIAPVPP